MNHFKKVIATLTAITSMATLGTGVVSASAVDLDAINEKILNDTATAEDKLIAEYAVDEDSAKVAEYVADCVGEISLDDAELLMMTYADGAKSASDTEDFLNVNYYSSTNLAPTQHYQITLHSLFEDYKGDDKAFDESTKIKLDSNYVLYGGSYTIFDDLDAYDAEIICNYTAKTTAFKIGLTCNIVPKGNYYRVCKFPFKCTSLIDSEAKGQSKITQTSKDYFTCETYALGDADHNGIVNSTDTTYILKYLAMSNDLGFEYADREADITGIVNREAADFNEDSSIDVADAVSLNKYLVNN